MQDEATGSRYMPDSTAKIRDVPDKLGGLRVAKSRTRWSAAERHRATTFVRLAARSLNWDASART